MNKIFFFLFFLFSLLSSCFFFVDRHPFFSLEFGHHDLHPLSCPNEIVEIEVDALFNSAELEFPSRMKAWTPQANTEESVESIVDRFSSSHPGLSHTLPNDLPRTSSPSRDKLIQKSGDRVLTPTTPLSYRRIAFLHLFLGSFTACHSAIG